MNQDAEKIETLGNIKKLAAVVLCGACQKCYSVLSVPSGLYITPEHGRASKAWLFKSWTRCPVCNGDLYEYKDAAAYHAAQHRESEQRLTVRSEVERLESENYWLKKQVESLQAEIERLQHPQPTTGATCPVCRKPLTPGKHRGRMATYCSGACRVQAHRDRKSPECNGL